MANRTCQDRNERAGRSYEISTSTASGTHDLWTEATSAAPYRSRKREQLYLEGPRERAMSSRILHDRRHQTPANSRSDSACLSRTCDHGFLLRTHWIAERVTIDTWARGWLD